MRVGRHLSIAAVTLVLTWASAWAEVPNLLNYQGKLTDPSGNPKNGTFSMTFAVYDAASGGNQLPGGTPWSETQNVTVTNGVFNVLLGSVTALPATLFAGGPSDAAGPLRFLQVTVSGEVLVPRSRIASAAYAIQGSFSAPDGPCIGNDAADIMVRVGSLCVDKYESSVWSSASGGTEYGASADDYPCNDNGSNCTNIYARSVAGVLPSRYITHYQAQQACKNSGKRLLSGDEWLMAGAGTPEPGAAGNGTTTCNTNTAGTVVTGSTGNCVSNSNVYDMVGNVADRTADYQVRGGTWSGAAVDTLFATSPGVGAQDSHPEVGFRYGR